MNKLKTQRWELLFNVTKKLKVGSIVSYDLITAIISKNRHCGQYSRNFKKWVKAMKKVDRKPIALKNYGYVLLSKGALKKLRYYDD